MAGLLGGVLPAIYSGADQLKRQVYGLLTNPTEMAQRAGQNLLQSRAERQALMGQAFANPDRPFQVTDANALAQVTNDVMAGELGFAPAGITAFHGSPNIFDKFDMSKVGSGSGMQAYGHGMYFAESPDIAKGFAKETVEMRNLRAIKDSSQANINFAEDVLSGKIKKPVDTQGNEIPDEWFAKQIENSKNEIKMADEKLKPFGQTLYKVDIPDEKIPNMLNWYEEVPEELRSKLSKKALDDFGSGLTGTSGKDLYNDVAFSFRMNGSKTPEVDASKWLNDLGVSGIKYENFQIKGGKGADTSNFVVFDPTDVKILERNNQPVEDLLGNTNLTPIYHGTDPKAAKAIEKSGFDINRSADGTIWFTSNPDIGEVAATGKGAVVQRYLDENKVKLGGWNEIDKYSVDELLQKGFDGVKLQDETGTVFQIFNPEKLSKGLLGD